MVNSIEHTARRPDWARLACGEPWPCAPAVANLRRAYHPAALRKVAAAYRADAAGDLTGVPAATLDRRFVRCIGD